MLKRLVIIAFGLITVSVLTAQPATQGAGKNSSLAASDRTAPEKSASNSPSPVTVNVLTPSSANGNDSGTAQENLDIQRKLVLFTAVLALVGLLQFLTMFWQGRVLRGTLKAVEQQAAIAKTTLVSSFRPKVVLRSIKLNPPNYATYLAVNDGIWKVELILTNTGSTKASIEKCDLHIAFFGDQPFPWSAQGAPLGSKEWAPFVLPPADRYPLEFVIPRESGFSIGFGTQVEMLRMPNNHGQAVWPTCSGTIVYVDDNGHRRQTGFSRRWNIPAERFESSEDPDLEYQD